MARAVVTSVVKDLLPVGRGAGPSLWCAVLLGLGACRGDAVTSSRNATYTAALLGSSTRPVATRSTATASATIAVTGATATYRIFATGFATPLTAGHIHIGGLAVTGPVVVPFSIVAQSGDVASGTIDLSVPITFNTLTISADSLRALFETGMAYVNLHTGAWPDGEIRGQIRKER